MVTIEQRNGIVRSVQEGRVVVRIQQQSACSGCHAKEFCCSTDCTDRDITIHTDSGHYAPGDIVVIQGRDSIGRLAVFLSFVLPIILFVCGLSLGLQILSIGEGLSILLAFFSLVIYFLLLHLFEPKLGRIIRFEIVNKAE